MTILTILNDLGGSNVIPKALKCEERSQEREEVTVMSSENLTIIANSEEGSGGHEPRTVAAFAKKKQSLSSNLQETCRVGPPKMDGSWWSVLTKCVSLEKGMANHFTIPASRNP